mmetsp:Transcript_146500/g.255548  ORF Transcript_146500/g.255548 Transcript_146500/m.255548 type:complete len:186 (+) Transcript_146500:45-602(+)
MDPYLVERSERLEQKLEIVRGQAHAKFNEGRWTLQEAEGFVEDFKKRLQVRCSGTQAGVEEENDPLLAALNALASGGNWQDFYSKVGEEYIKYIHARIDQVTTATSRVKEAILAKQQKDPIACAKVLDCVAGLLVHVDIASRGGEEGPDDDAIELCNEIAAILEDSETAGIALDRLQEEYGAVGN